MLALPAAILAGRSARGDRWRRPMRATEGWASLARRGAALAVADRCRSTGAEVGGGGVCDLLARLSECGTKLTERAPTGPRSRAWRSRKLGAGRSACAVLRSGDTRARR